MWPTYLTTVSKRHISLGLPWCSGTDRRLGSDIRWVSARGHLSMTMPISKLRTPWLVLSSPRTDIVDGLCIPLGDFRW